MNDYLFVQGGDKNLTDANSIEIIYEDTQPPTIHYDLKYPFCQVKYLESRE